MKSLEKLLTDRSEGIVQRTKKSEGIVQRT